MADEEEGLGEFEGRPVLSAAVELPSLAGGLREAAEVQGGTLIHRGDTVYILIKATGAKTRFDPVKNTDGFQRVDIPVVEGLAFVSGKAFEAAIDRQNKAIEKNRLAKQKEKEAAQGVQRVPGTEPWEGDDGLPEDDDDGDDGEG